jgi:hypothetical protein
MYPPVLYRPMVKAPLLDYGMRTEAGRSQGPLALANLSTGEGKASMFRVLSIGAFA